MTVNHTKTILKIIALLMFAGAAGREGTLAYLSSFDKKTNIATTGYNETSIEEEFPSITPTPVEKDPHYIKKIQISNTGGIKEAALSDCYVRAELSYSNSDIGNAVVLDGLNKKDWVYRDGFYYYNHILKKGEATAPLITGFHIDHHKVNAKYQALLKDFEMNVYEESVQAEGFSSVWDAFAYYSGSPAEEGGGK